MVIRKLYAQAPEGLRNLSYRNLSYSFLWEGIRKLYALALEALRNLWHPGIQPALAGGGLADCSDTIRCAGGVADLAKK